MASVRVEEEARRDPRFVLLGKKLGTTKFDALARMIELWAYCTENQTQTMREDIIDICAEFDGFAKLIGSVEINLGEIKDNGLIRIKGTKGRIEWLRKLRNNGKKGGRPKKTKQKPDGFENETRSEPPPNPPTPILIPSPVLEEKNLYLSTHAREAAEIGPDSEEQKKCEQAWLETLEHFKAPRKFLTYQEKVSISQAIKRFGGIQVQAALAGRRFEASTQSFKPENYLSIHRTFESEKFDNFVNLAAKKVAERKARVQ